MLYSREILPNCTHSARYVFSYAHCFTSGTLYAALIKDPAKLALFYVDKQQLKYVHRRASPIPCHQQIMR